MRMPERYHFQMTITWKEVAKVTPEIWDFIHKSKTREGAHLKLEIWDL